MIFHINATLPAKKSGIEHAELKRIRLFKKNKLSQKLILREWDPNLHAQARKENLDDDQILNLFDYFQGTEVVSAKHVTLEDLDWGVPNWKVDPEPQKQRFLIWQGSQLLARVNYDQNDGERVKSVEWFDAWDNLYQVQHYDERGFVSLVQWYTPDNQIHQEVWLDLNGRPVLENSYKYTMQSKHQLLKTNWLLRHAGKTYQFDTLDEIMAYFLNTINNLYYQKTQPNIFILDRAHLGDAGLLKLDLPAYRVLHLHNAHTSDAQNPLEADLNNHYEYALANLSAYDAVISATPQQTHDLQARFRPQSQLFTIPVGIIEQRLLDQPPVPLQARTFGKMVVFARIANEKRLDDLVRAVALGHQSIPELTLDIYGYADPTDNYGARRAIEQLITTEKLEQVITLQGYTEQIDAVENDAMLYGLTSRMEGFNLALMEATSHGLIGITYDVNYGPNEIIQDQVNGRVVEYGNYEALAAAIVQILQNPALLNKYMQGAYDLSQRYSEANVMQAWQTLFDAANTSFSPALKHH
ncbi:accessory Sec system glycosyltransferase Asp1 [Weissella coleopterorum]|uniref:Accessory Sec system glycosyltransferase Asp1 n=1 Tax=Weissella coleopterorum TaxID=2714949 RepID=A0A6G8B1J5_9LACO|nr:accessory Sec system glycosyltransferase Asp1 [Weissella coleopterorum]QIL51201.1 accessory Sec system glycosyltransferase Asp1 [Weissella coleopterorum]